MTRILGIDPGTATTGYAILDRENTGQLKLIRAGVITTSKKAAQPQRLFLIFQKLSDIIRQEDPHHISVEQLFFAKNVKTALSVGESRGVVLLLAAKFKLKFFQYKPSQVKQAVSGYGAASKFQVQKMVKILLRLKEIPKPDDVADALAVAICHANHLKLKFKIEK